MSDINLEVAERARDWIGTPYVHQASLKGVGCDCLGLIRGIWREVFGEEPGPVPAYTRDWSEATGEERLWNAARTHLRERPMSDRSIGQVVLLRMRDGSVAKHLGVLGSRHGDASLIHAYSGCGVVESALVGPWERRVVAVFEFPGRDH
jgi:NlpC/P60 family putative phage cell wall peptidase